MATTSLISGEAHQALLVQAASLPHRWKAAGQSIEPQRARFECVYDRFTLRFDVLPTAGSSKLAFEVRLLTRRALLPQREETLLVLVVAPDPESIARAFDRAWQVVAGRRDIEVAAQRDLRRSRAAG